MSSLLFFPRCRFVADTFHDLLDVGHSPVVAFQVVANYPRVARSPVFAKFQLPASLLVFFYQFYLYRTRNFTVCFKNDDNFFAGRFWMVGVWKFPPDKQVAINYFL
jgi:hypothetical protein